MQFYRKFSEKSRRVFKGKVFSRIDILFFLLAFAVFVFFTIDRIVNVVVESISAGVIDVYVSEQFNDLFGSKTTSALIQEFEGLNPDIKINILQPETQNEAQIESDEIIIKKADIVFFDDSEIGELINSSALKSLEPFVFSEDQGMHQTEKWALPLVAFVDLFAFNIDILEAANLDRPPKTQREFISACRAISRIDAAKFGKKFIYGFGLGLNQYNPRELRRNFFPWIWANGEDILRPDSNGDDVFLSITTFQILDLFDELYRNEFIAPNVLFKKSTHVLDEFIAGEIAMFTVSAKDFAHLQQNSGKVNFGVTSIPSMVQGKNRLGISKIYVGINSECQIVEESWLFLAFLSGKTRKLATELYAIPGQYPSNYPGEYITKDPLLKKAWEIFETADIVEYYPDYLMETATNNAIKEKMSAVFK